MPRGLDHGLFICTLWVTLLVPSLANGSCGPVPFSKMADTLPTGHKS
jgi:hypothetical protein